MKTKQATRIFSAIAIITLALANCQNEPETPPPQTVATPTATPASGEVADNTPITLATSTAGAAIHYTQDGTEPTAESALYSDSNKPIITTNKLTLKAIAVKSGMTASATLTATYTLTPPDTVAMPTATPASGEVADNTPITLATSTAGAAIHYTQDGTEPTAESALYSDTAKPVITAGKLTLKAIAVKSGMNNSAILTEPYTIATATPPTASITNNNQTVTLAPELEITLNGAATKGTNEIKSYEWTVKTTENGVTPVFTSTATAVTKVTGIKKAGTYVFELKVKDTADLEATATATVAVNGYTVTTTLTIASNSFSTTPGTNLDFTPSYTNVSNPTDFTTAVINSCLTYTITVVNHEGDYTHTWNSTDVNFDGKILPSDKYTTDLATFTQTFYNNGQVVGTPRVLKVMVADGKFEYFGEGYGGTGSVPALTGITISKTITEILPPPVTKTVTVPAITTVANPMDFGAVSSLTGWDADFPSTDVTYTVTLSKGGSTITTVNSTSATSISAADKSNDDYTLTQTFYYKGSPITGGSRSVGIEVFGNRFAEMYVSETDYTAGSLIQLTLTLTKQ